MRIFLLLIIVLSNQKTSFFQLEKISKNEFYSSISLILMGYLFYKIKNLKNNSITKINSLQTSNNFDDFRNINYTIYKKKIKDNLSKEIISDFILKISNNIKKIFFNSYNDKIKNVKYIINNNKSNIYSTETIKKKDITDIKNELKINNIYSKIEVVLNFLVNPYLKKEFNIINEIFTSLFKETLTEYNKKYKNVVYIDNTLIFVFSRFKDYIENSFKNDKNYIKFIKNYILSKNLFEPKNQEEKYIIFNERDAIFSDFAKNIFYIIYLTHNNNINTETEYNNFINNLNRSVLLFEKSIKILFKKYLKFLYKFPTNNFFKIISKYEELKTLYRKNNYSLIELKNSDFNYNKFKKNLKKFLENKSLYEKILENANNKNVNNEKSHVYFLINIDPLNLIELT